MEAGFVQNVCRMSQPIDGMSLIQAVQDDSISAVQDLLEKKVEVNYRNSEGKSAFYYAIKNKNPLIVKLLLDKGAFIYYDTNDDEIITDLAIEFYDLEGNILNTNEKKIVNLIEEKILKDSIHVLKDSLYEFWSSHHVKIEMHKPSLDEAKAEVHKKISVLLGLLADRNSSNYKDANTFIQLLETFSFDDDLTRHHVVDLKSEFLKGDITAFKSIKNFRTAVLHIGRTILDPESIFDSIRGSFVPENKDSEVDKKIQFFDKLEKFLKQFKVQHSDEPFENYIVSNFFMCPDKQKGDIIKKDQQDNANDKIIYKKFMNLIVKVFKNEIDEEEFWFEFNVNICRCLGIVNKQRNNKICDRICDTKREILRFRNKSVHSFDQCVRMPDHYKSNILWLTDKLFEYYYAKKLHESLISGITRKVEKIEEEICKDFENILNEFSHDINRLSKGTSPNCLLYNQKIVLEPMLSIMFDQTLVESYFMFMPIIDFEIKNELDDLSRRQFLERFEDIKKSKEKNDEENYLQEKERLISDLSAFGADKKYVEKMFRYYLEEGNTLSDATIVIVKNVIKFIMHIGYTIIYSEVEDNLIDIVENILTDPFNLKPEDISDIPMVQKLVRTFTSVKIYHKKVDVKTTIKTMVKTLCNYSYLYGMKKKFNKTALFSSERFLNALLNEEKKLFDYYSQRLEADKLSLFKSMRLYTWINQLIKIDYMSPFIVKLLKDLDTEDSEFIKSLIDEDMMRRLIKNLANKNCLNYLSTLLLVEFETYIPYTLLYEYITVNIQNLDLNGKSKPHIFSIFKYDFSYINSSLTFTLHFDHIKGFADVLTSIENEQSSNYTEEIIIPFLEIINEEVKYQLSYRSCEWKESILTEVLLKSIEIEYKFSNKVNQFTPCYLHFIERDILQAKIIISSEEYDASKVINLLKSVIDKLDTCEDIKHKEMHDRYKLLIFVLFPDISKFFGLDYQHLYCKILKHVNGEDYEDTEIENVAKIYKEIKKSKIYKELLSTSQLLSSSKHLNVLGLAFKWISSVLEDIQHRECDFEGEDEKKLLNILKVYQSIYPLIRRSRNLYFHGLPRMSADIYKQLGIVCEANNNYDGASSYCLKALARFKIQYKRSLQSIEDDVLTLLSTFISAQYNFSKTLTNKQDLNKREDILKKVDDLCKRFLDCDKQSSALEKWPKQYPIFLSTAENASYDRGLRCIEKNLFSDAIQFFRKSVKSTDIL